MIKDLKFLNTISSPSMIRKFSVSIDELECFVIVRMVWDKRSHRSHYRFLVTNARTNEKICVSKHPEWNVMRKKILEEALTFGLGMSHNVARLS